MAMPRLMAMGALVALVVANLVARSSSQALKPNVVFIVIDDLGFDDVGFRSHEIKTPVIDNLAATGVVLDQYYVQDVCSPSRATFMTGRYSMHNTIVDWIPPASAYGLPLNETTLAQKMAEAGYACHATGKWHLGFYKWEMTPTFRGFESFVGFYSGGEDYFKHISGAGYDFRRDMSPRCGPGCSQVDWQDQGTYSTTVFTSEAVRVVSSHDFSEKPLFLYLAYQGVHAPAEVPASYVYAYNSSIADPKRRTFAGMLSAVDEGIGNVTAMLKSKGALQNTLIIFTADNGGPTTTGDGVGARNWPLRGGKHSIWEGGTRVTGLLWGTARLRNALASGAAKPLYTGLMHGADWLPTLSSVAGFSLNGTLPLDGFSQWNGILGGAQPRNLIVIGNSTNMCSWTEDDPRYHGNANPTRDGSDLPVGFYGSSTSLGCGFAIKEYVGVHHWKLIKGYGGGPDTWCNSSKAGPVCAEPTSTRDKVNSAPPEPVSTCPNGWCLYDTAADPHEEHEVSGSNADVVASMQKELSLILQSYRQYEEDKSCPPQKFEKDPHVGNVWSPWC